VHDDPPHATTVREAREYRGVSPRVRHSRTKTFPNTIETEYHRAAEIWRATVDEDGYDLFAVLLCRSSHALESENLRRRTVLMKSRATGLSARLVSVTIPIDTAAIGNSTRKTLISTRPIGNLNIDAGPRVGLRLRGRAAARRATRKLFT
jgi:hypothetical protein